MPCRSSVSGAEEVHKRLYFVDQNAVSLEDIGVLVLEMAKSRDLLLELGDPAPQPILLLLHLASRGVELGDLLAHGAKGIPGLQDPPLQRPNQLDGK